MRRCGGFGLNSCYTGRSSLCVTFFIPSSLLMSGVYSMDRCGRAPAASRLLLNSAHQTSVKLSVNKAVVGVTPPRKAL